MGADGVSGNLKIFIEGTHVPPSPHFRGVRGFIDYDQPVTPATGDSLANRHLFQTGTIAISGFVDIDLQLVLDAYGSALNATSLVGFALEAGVNNGDIIRINDLAANGFTGFMTAGSAIRVRPGQVFAMTGLQVGSRMTVSPTNKVIRLQNQSGVQTATFTLYALTID